MCLISISTITTFISNISQHIKKLENVVETTNNAYVDWQACTKSGRISWNEKDFFKLLGGLKKAEDDLARERFRKDVKDEWRRIESVVDIELERMATLEEGVDLDLYDQLPFANEEKWK